MTGWRELADKVIGQRNLPPELADRIIERISLESSGNLFRSSEYPDPGPQWPSEIQVLCDTIDDRLEKTFVGGAT